jgi:hypothetical protein
LHAGGPERQAQRVRPAGHAHGVGDADNSGELALEGLDLRPEDEGPRAEYTPHRRLELRLELGRLPREVDEGDVGLRQG